jgi:hypothetical protein
VRHFGLVDGLPDHKCNIYQLFQRFRSQHLYSSLDDRP